MRKSIFLLLFFCLQISLFYSQFTVNYPSIAQDIPVCNGSSILTVRINFFSNSSNNTVTITLPTGINYVAGSELMTSSSGVTGISYASGPSNAPVFNLSPAAIVAGSFIEFRISRTANCAARAFSIAGGDFKDNILVSGTAGTFNENNINLNQYNLILPNVAILSPPVNNTGVLGSNYTSTITLNNGGLGCVNNLYFFVINPLGSIQHTALSLGGTPLIPYDTSGDTLFYAISGTSLTADQQLCNGESISLVHSYKYISCSGYPSYGTGWGCEAILSAWCQLSLGNQVITVASGTALYSAFTCVKQNFVNMCTPYQLLMTFTNGGSGNAQAATMYDVEILQGYYPTPSIYAMDQSVHNFSNYLINGVSVPFSYVGGYVTVNLTNVLTSDPDGPGGISDVDGDGFFDDLTLGSSFSLTCTTSLNCNKPCGYSTYLYYQSAVMKYRDMCNPGRISASGLGAYTNTLFEYDFVGTGYVPANVTAGTPFTVNLNQTHYYNANDLETPNTRYRWKLVLPPGFSVAGSGSPTYNLLPATYTQIGDTIIFTSLTNQLANYAINLVYTCGTNGSKELKYFLEKLNDVNTCACLSKKICASLFVNTLCPNACAIGPSTYLAKVRRSNGSLGYTSTTFATRQNPALISDYNLSKALYRDTIEIHGSSKAFANRTNIHVELTLNKTVTPIVVNKLTPVNVFVKLIRGGVVINTATLTTFTMAASTATKQSIDWNLSGVLIGGLQAGDSIYTLSRYVVSTNEGLPEYDVQSGDKWKFFTLQGAVKEICAEVVPEMYLVGTRMVNGTNGHFSNGCTSVALGGGSNYIARRFSTAGTLFTNEFRPVFRIDSMVFDIPSGYDYVSSNIDGIPMSPNYILGTKHTFLNPGNWTVPLLTVTNNYGSIIPVIVKPTCATQATEIINYKIYVGDYYYSYVGQPTPAGLSYPVTSFYGTIPTSVSAMPGLTIGINYNELSRPNISMSNLSGQVQADVATETADIRLSNVGTSTAPYNWIAIPNKSTYTITQVLDLTSMTAVAPILYPGGKWYQLSTAGINSGAFKNYRISFTYTNCNIDSIKVYSGWDCSAYPTTPLTYDCIKDSLFIRFLAVGAEVQILPVSVQPMPTSACQNMNYVYSILSSGQGNISQLSGRLKLPVGLSLVGSYQAEYPAGSGNWANIPSTVGFGGWLQYNLQLHPNYPPSGGLPGTNNALNPLAREFRVRFTLISDCSFASGSNFQVAASGRKSCGQFATGSFIPFQSPPISLTGANLALIIANSSTVSPSTISCNGVATVTMTSSIFGATTSNNATIVLLIPPNLDYVAGSLNCTSGSCPTFVSNTTMPDGSESVLLSVPNGLAIGTVMNYTFQIRDNVAKSCGNLPTYITSFGSVSNIPCATAVGGICPSSPVQIGQTSFTLGVNNAELQLGTVNVDFSPSVPNTFIGEANVSNVGMGSFNPSDNATISYYCADVSGNPVGPAVGTVAISTTIAVGGSQFTSTQFTTTACAIPNSFTAVLSSTGTCACVVDTVKSLTMVNVLPISLLSLSADRIDARNVNVKWTTQSENNSSYFIIQRSLDATLWETVSSKNASGFSNELIDYTLLDESAYSEESYYRIQQFDTDGEVEVFGPVMVNKLNQNDALFIYPNPNEGIFTFSKDLVNATIEITDEAGRLVESRILKVNSLDVSKLESGTYILHVKEENGNKSILKLQIVN